MELTAIPGVGEKTAQALGELDDPERALRRGDVAALARAPDISPGHAARIARAAIQHRHDDPGDFLATDRAEDVYDALLSIIQRYAETPYARSRLLTFYPSATDSRITEAREFVAEAIDRGYEPSLDDTLTAVAPLEEPGYGRIRDRCLATGDVRTYERASEAFPELSIEHVDNKRDIFDLASGYGEVIILDERFAGFAFDENVRVEPDAIDQPVAVVPERTLRFFGANRDPILAAIEVHRQSDIEPPCDLSALEDALSLVEADGSIAGDEELFRLQQACDDLDAATATAESIANDHLREAIERTDVTVEGADLLSLVERGAGVESLLERELADDLETACERACEHLIDALSLTDTEADLARELFAPEPRYPIERDPRIFDRLEETLTYERDRHTRQLTLSVANDLATMREPTELLIRESLELDVQRAIARFVDDHDCIMPEFVDDGISIEEGRGLLLNEPSDAIDPVDYHIRGVTLLTGVNSGGKTSTLDLLAQTVILAQMGFPVPARDATVQRFDRLHYHAKTQGTLDAGAFETTVKQFARLSETSEHSLVLVDELESITEPGASARIIAGFLEALAASEATAVFVSHLAEEIVDFATIEVAVDGIEAEGLIDGTLVVNRSPRKDHIARSTPELIVEKLAEEASDTDFYAGLLEKFDDE